MFDFNNKDMFEHRIPKIPYIICDIFVLSVTSSHSILTNTERPGHMVWVTSAPTLILIPYFLIHSYRGLDGVLLKG